MGSDIELNRSAALKLLLTKTSLQTAMVIDTDKRQSEHLAVLLRHMFGRSIQITSHSSIEAVPELLVRKPELVFLGFQIPCYTRTQMALRSLQKREIVAPLVIVAEAFQRRLKLDLSRLGPIVFMLRDEINIGALAEAILLTHNHEAFSSANACTLGDLF